MLSLRNTATGLPMSKYTNFDLESTTWMHFKKEGKDANYIVNKFGFENRFWVKADTSGRITNSVDLMVYAGKAALSNAQLKPSDIDLLISVTTTSPRYTSSTATMTASKLGIHCPSFEMKTGCATSLYSIIVAAQFIQNGTKNVLIVFGETISRILPKNSNILYAGGDGGAAIVLSEDIKQDSGIIYSVIGSDGKYANAMGVLGPLPPEKRAIENNEYVMTFSNEANPFIAQMWETIPGLLYRGSGLNSEGINYLVTHQANKDYINLCGKAANISTEKMIDLLSEYGNCGPVSIINAVHYLRIEKEITTNATIMMVAVGGGISWGGIILKI